MAFSELEKKTVEAELSLFIETHRPPENIRDQVDIGFNLENQSVVLFEIRPRWNKHDEKMESPVAKATYSKAQQVWKVYWMRADLKWHRYAPTPSVDRLDGFLRLVDEDKNACFWG